MKEFRMVDYGGITAEQGMKLFEDIDAALQAKEDIQLFVTPFVTRDFVGTFVAFLMEKYGYKELAGHITFAGPAPAVKMVMEMAAYARRIHTDTAFRLAERAPFLSKYN